MRACAAVQGLGAGVILALTEIILADLVPLRERGAYQGAIGLIWSIASIIGPLVVRTTLPHAQSADETDGLDGRVVHSLLGQTGRGAACSVSEAPTTTAARGDETRRVLNTEC